MQITNFINLLEVLQEANLLTNYAVMPEKDGSKTAMFKLENSNEYEAFINKLVEKAEEYDINFDSNSEFLSVAITLN